MILNELLDPIPSGYRDEKEDNSGLTLSDFRKRRQLSLTLDKLNRLRAMNDARKLEHEQKLEKVADQYKLQAAEVAPGL
jgi:uncharacterized protein YkwD